MELIDNKSKLLGDDLKREIAKGASVKMVASYFSIYAFEALKEELSNIEELQFIFPAPTFVRQGIQENITFQCILLIILCMVQSLKFVFVINLPKK